MSSVPVVTYSVRLVVLELRVEILGDEDLYVQVRMRRIMINDHDDDDNDDVYDV